MRDVLTALITALIGAGGAGFIATIFRGVRSLRSGARAIEREAIADLVRRADEADERARRASADVDFWRADAGRLRYQMLRAGIEPRPADPVPPSER